MLTNQISGNDVTATDTGVFFVFISEVSDIFGRLVDQQLMDIKLTK